MIRKNLFISMLLTNHSQLNRVSYYYIRNHYVSIVSKAFMRNLSQIRELQRYVNILREANLNPDEHLTEEQKELLLSAEYYDRLNAATAYFPTSLINQQQYSGDEEMEGGEDDGEEEEDGGQGQGRGGHHDNIGSEPIEEN